MKRVLNKYHGGNRIKTIAPHNIHFAISPDLTDEQAFLQVFNHYTKDRNMGTNYG